MLRKRKLTSEKRKNSLLAKKKSLVGSTPVLIIVKLLKIIIMLDRIGSIMVQNFLRKFVIFS